MTRSSGILLFVLAWVCGQEKAARAQDATLALVEPSTTVAELPESVENWSRLSNYQKPGFFLSGEMLFLIPNRQGLDFAVTNQKINGYDHRTLNSLSWGWNPGFRVGGYYRFAESGVDLGASFTFLRAVDNQAFSASQGGYLSGVTPVHPDASRVTSAMAEATLNYSVVDMDLGKTFALGESVVIRPLGGVRIASINQTFDSSFSGGDLGSWPVSVNNPVRFTGAGLTGGAEATWLIQGGLGVYGKGRGGLVSGLFDNKRTEYVGSMMVSSASDSIYSIVPFLELGAGVSYTGERWFVSVGYEVINWINMASGVENPWAPIGYKRERKSDLSLEGISLKLGFFF